MGDPIHFTFGSRVGFSGSADRMALFTVQANPRWRPPPCWKNFKWRYLTTSRPIHFMFCSRVGFSGTAPVGRITYIVLAQTLNHAQSIRDGRSNGAIFDSNKLKMAAAAILDNFEWPYLRNGSRSIYIVRIARSSLR